MNQKINRNVEQSLYSMYRLCMGLKLITNNQYLIMLLSQQIETDNYIIKYSTNGE